MSKAFGDWGDSYNELPRLYEAFQKTNPGTIIQYTSSPVVVDGQAGPSYYILECIFWAFGSCIQGLNYCKLIVQVDGTFLIGIYHGTLLTLLGQDGSHNIFPLGLRNSGRRDK